MSKTNSFVYALNGDWKVGDKLTINLGLRFDYIGVPYDADGRWRRQGREILLNELPKQVFEDGV